MTDPRGAGQAPYLHGHGESVLRSHRWRTAENSAAYLLDALRPGTDLLDVGCGAGTITAGLARRVAPGRVLGVDTSESVLATAAGALAKAGIKDAELFVGDAQALELPDGAVDVVHAHQVLQHLSDPVAALREMRRVVRPGGLIAVRDADYAAMTWYPAVPELEQWRDLYRRVARTTGGEPDAGRRLQEWAGSAGLTDVVCSATAWCFATPADRAWWGGTWAERVTGSDLATQALGTGLATEPELKALAEGWRRWVAEPSGWFAVLHGELLARV